MCSMVSTEVQRDSKLKGCTKEQRLGELGTTIINGTSINK